MAPNADRPIVKMRQRKKRKAQVRKSGKVQGGEGTSIWKIEIRQKSPHDIGGGGGR
jgi:hypothetical protein